MARVVPNRIALRHCTFKHQFRLLHAKTLDLLEKLHEARVKRILNCGIHRQDGCGRCRGRFKDEFRLEDELPDVLQSLIKAQETDLTVIVLGQHANISRV